MSWPADVDERTPATAVDPSVRNDLALFFVVLIDAVTKKWVCQGSRALCTRHCSPVDEILLSIWCACGIALQHRPWRVEAWPLKLDFCFTRFAAGPDYAEVVKR